MAEFFKNMFLYLLLIAIIFGFLAVCNWEYNPAEWNGFSRFWLAIGSITSLKVFIDN